MALLLHYTGQDYISRGLLNTELTPGSTSAFANGCKTGRGFAFDGTVNSALTSNTPLNYNTISVSAWFRMNINSVNGDRYEIFSTAAGGAIQLLFEVVDINRIRVLYYDSIGFGREVGTNNNAISPNVWYHAHCSVSISGKISLYLNGSLVNSINALSNPFANITRWFIGRRVEGRTFNGQICNLKVYNHVLSAREIAEDYKSLILHYKLDKPITTQVFDHSGFNRHITVIENTTTNSTTEKRVYGGSLSNNGTQSLYGNLNLSDLNGLNEISFACSFRISDISAPRCMFSARTSAGGAGFAFYKEIENRVLSVDMGSRSSVKLPSDFILNKWYTMCAVKTPNQQLVYIDGVLISTLNTTSLTNNVATSIMSISASSANTNAMLYHLNGNVQDIRFYAKALTQADVTELYQTRNMVDKDSNCYTYELIEGQATVGMNKQGQLLCDEIIENEDGVFQIVSNKTIKTKEIKEI